MKRLSKRLVLAILLLLALTVAVVVAVGLRGETCASQASQQMVKNSKEKADALDTLSEGDMKKGKSTAKRSAAKKPKAKPAAAADTTVASADDLDGATSLFSDAIKRSDDEREKTKKVSDATKKDLAKYKDALVSHYRLRLEDARIGGRPDDVMLYESTIKNIETIAALAAKDSLDNNDVSNLSKSADSEDKQFNSILKKTDKTKLNAEQKMFLKERTAAVFQESVTLFMRLLDQVQGLINELRSTASSPSQMASGCASAMKSAASGDKMEIPGLGSLQTLLTLFQTSIGNYKATIETIGMLTQ